MKEYFIIIFILHKENKIQLSITRLSNLTEKLEKEKIPFIFLFPSEDNIKDTIEHMISEIKIAGLDDKKNNSWKNQAFRYQ